MSQEDVTKSVDEDWKSQVEQEKQQPAAESAADAEEGKYPPADFNMLMTMLITQAMAAMGLITPPGGETPPVDLDLAKHFIDLLTVLEKKTEGNLDEEEAKQLEGHLHQLRMVFIQMKNQGS